MTNGDRLRNMTDEQLSDLFCGAVATVGEKLGVDYYCKFCPATDLCRPGHTGFLEYLKREAEED